MAEDTDFDAQLRALAARLMADEAVPAFPDRAWHVDSLFRAIQSYATIKSDQPTTALLAACEAMGRAKLALAREHGQG